MQYIPMITVLAGILITGHLHALYTLGKINADGTIKRNCNFAMEVLNSYTLRYLMALKSRKYYQRNWLISRVNYIISRDILQLQ